VVNLDPSYLNINQQEGGGFWGGEMFAWEQVPQPIFSAYILDWELGTAIPQQEASRLTLHAKST
jgi:hypothetical protein